MPSRKVFSKFKAGKLHSGSKSGPVVRDRDQAVAIYLSEKHEESEGRGHERRERRRPTRSKR